MQGDERSLLDWGSLGPGGEVFSLKTARPIGHYCSCLVLASDTKWVVEDEGRAALSLHKELLQISCGSSQGRTGLILAMGC